MITNQRSLTQQFPASQPLLELADSALQQLQPVALVQQAVQLRGQVLVIQGQRFNLKQFQHIYVVGAGKATYGMAQALVRILGTRITSGYINVPVVPRARLGNIQVQVASHPFPDTATQRATKNVMHILQQATKHDLVICLMSGGGSSMLPAPAAGLSLNAKVRLTKQLMRAGATIHELNTVRKHLSALKGGRLAQLAGPATVVSLIISDVIGNDLSFIASGPTVPDTTTCAEAVTILERYRVGNALIKKIICRNESPKSLSNPIYNFLIGSNHLVLEGLAQQAKQLKLNPFILTSQLQGEAKEVARILMAIAQEIVQFNRPIKKPALLLAGGETTVTVLGKGHGGRNQELVLAAVPFLNERMSVLSLATDGVDGLTPQPVAGALADGKVRDQCVLEGIDYSQYLYANNSYHCLKQLGCLLHTGPTGTNVGDIVMVLIR